MMKLKVEHVAMLAVTGLPPDGELEVPPGSTAQDLLERLRLSPAHQRVVAVFVNERRVHASAALSEGDRIFLGLPMGGG